MLAADADLSTATTWVRVPDGQDRGPAMLKFLNGLRSWQLFVLAAVLFAVDVLVPDPIPFLDEALLGLLTYALARWKKVPPA